MKHLFKTAAIVITAAMLLQATAFGADITTVGQPSETGGSQDSAFTTVSQPAGTADTQDSDITVVSQPAGTADTQDTNVAAVDQPSETGDTQETDVAAVGQSAETGTPQDTDVAAISQPAGTADPTRDYVRHLYSTLLGREPEAAGLTDWTNRLKSKAETGAEVVQGIVFSDEFKNKKLSDENYVTILYSALFDRGPDSSGYNGWVSDLKDGLSRNYVLAGFIGSEEFHKLCAKYGINPGSIEISGIVDENPLITHFVSYIYRYLMGRQNDPKGLEDWVNRLATHTETAAEVVSGFVFSDEFIDKNLSDKDYVSVLYRTILDRDLDNAGFADWCGKLENGMSRLYVLRGFIQSSEFGELCEEYEITPGTITSGEARDRDAGVTRFVMLSYQNALNRKATAGELNNWCTVLLTGTKPSDYLSTILFSPESQPSSLSDDAFVSRLYQLVLQRAPSEKERTDALAALKSGDRKNLFNQICGLDEYRLLVTKYNLREARYQNPPEYYQVKDYIAPLTGGNYDLTYNFEGLKVAWVIKRLKVNYGNYVGMGTKAEYTYAVAAAVKNFQKNNNLEQTGIVNLETWLAMGYSEDEWYHLGTYVSPLRTNAMSTREDHIEAMIATAYEYLDTPYVVGASGAPGLGLDCSGLAMQALYGAGIDMETITPVTHSYPGHEYESANMWLSPKFKHVPYSERQRGDLIFYQDGYGNIIHVAIYLGNNQVIESTVPANKVIIANIINGYRANIKGVARPFI